MISSDPIAQQFSPIATTCTVYFGVLFGSTSVHNHMLTALFAAPSNTRYYGAQTSIKNCL